MQYMQHGVEVKYYADGEDGLDMRKILSREIVGLPPLPRPEAKWALPPGPTAASVPKPPAVQDAPASAAATNASATAAPSGTTPPGGPIDDDAVAEIEPGTKDIAAAVSGESVGSPAGGEAGAKKPKKKKK